MLESLPMFEGCSVISDRRASMPPLSLERLGLVFATVDVLPTLSSTSFVAACTSPAARNDLLALSKGKPRGLQRSGISTDILVFSNV